MGALFAFNAVPVCAGFCPMLAPCLLERRRIAENDHPADVIVPA
ncbi:hypothetical protein [Streptosporangium subroseum]|nr:hypothetical protein [Streptosporangium subroseum]